MRTHTCMNTKGTNLRKWTKRTFITKWNGQTFRSLIFGLIIFERNLPTAKHVHVCMYM